MKEVNFKKAFQCKHGRFQRQILTIQLPHLEVSDSQLLTKKNRFPCNKTEVAISAAC